MQGINEKEELEAEDFQNRMNRTINRIYFLNLSIRGIQTRIY